MTSSILLFSGCKSTEILNYPKIIQILTINFPEICILKEQFTQKTNLVITLKLLQTYLHFFVKYKTKEDALKMGETKPFKGTIDYHSIDVLSTMEVNGAPELFKKINVFVALS